MKEVDQDLIDRGFIKGGKVFQSGVIEAHEPESRVDPINPLTQVVEEFVTSPHTPELYTQTLQAIWKVRQDQLMQGGALLDLSVTPCPYTQEELDKLEKEGRRLGYLPPPISTQQNRYLMGKLWPEMQSYAVQQEDQEESPVTNEVDRNGWFDYDARVDGAPYRDTNEKELRKAIEKEGRAGMNLTEYIVASQDSKLFTGHYLDEVPAYVRLLGSRDEGYVVGAHFREDGYLYVIWFLTPQDYGSHLGGRSVGVSKAA